MARASGVASQSRAPVSKAALSWLQSMHAGAWLLWGADTQIWNRRIAPVSGRTH